MESRKTPPPSVLGNHFVDIHEVLHEEDEENMNSHHEEDKQGKISQQKQQIKNREGKRGSNNNYKTAFSRQVSLETGFSVLNGDSKRKEEEGRRVLSRSGKSLGAFCSVRDRDSRGGVGVGVDGRKGDFNMFRTKSALSRQNSSALPRRESGIMMMDSQKNDTIVEGIDESVNKSVPAGRYFAALRGPELDQVKVINYIFFNYLLLFFYTNILGLMPQPKGNVF